jgi:hypothetical protein
MAVPVQTKGTFSAGRPHMLFEEQYVPTPATLSDYDVSRDGQRFLILNSAGQAQAATQINVVLNWTEELKRLVSARNKLTFQRLPPLHVPQNRCGELLGRNVSNLCP